MANNVVDATPGDDDDDDKDAIDDDDDVIKITMMMLLMILPILMILPAYLGVPISSTVTGSSSPVWLRPAKAWKSRTAFFTCRGWSG